MTTAIKARTLTSRPTPTIAACTAPRHGSSSAARFAGCICPDALLAKRRYTKAQHQGRLQPVYVDPTGTQRRLRALAVLGWRREDIAAALGTSRMSIQHITIGIRPRVHRETAAAVRRLYWDLSLRPGPSEKTRQRALAQGWVGPMAWGGNIDDPKAQRRRGGQRSAA